MSKLDETFNLPTSISSDELEKVRRTLSEQNTQAETAAEQSDELSEEMDPMTQLALDEITEREKRVDDLIDLKKFDSDHDMIFDESFQAFRDAFTIAKEVPAGSAGKIFEAAAAFAKIALDAKGAKINARLSAIDLALKKRRLDTAEGKKDGDNPTNADSSFIDRNDLLKHIKDMVKEVHKDK